MLTLARKPHTKIVMASKGLGDAVRTGTKISVMHRRRAAFAYRSLHTLANQRENVNQRRREVHPSRVDREALSAWR